jgi:hypothetical protein
MPVETKATEQTAYCCDPIRIAASEYVTCDAVRERRESGWDHRVAFFVGCVIGFGIVCGFLLLFARAM